jgi:hypothetical protein
MLEEFNSENYMKTLVIKVSEISFSNLRDKQKSYTRLTQYMLHYEHVWFENRWMVASWCDE